MLMTRRRSTTLPSLLVTGLLLLCGRMHVESRNPFVPPGFTDKELREIEDLLQRVGFRNVQVERRWRGREVVGILAER